MSETKNPIMFPRYDSSILSVSASIARFYGIETPYKTNPTLDKELEKGYKNIVLIIADGMGVNVLMHHLPENAFLRQYHKETISSVFPPTTCAAMTSLRSGLPPIKHGWLGWSMYFKKFDSVVELFRGTELYTGEPVPAFNSAFEQMPFEDIWTQIQKHAPQVETTALFPDKINRQGIENLHQLMVRIHEQTRREKPQFIWAYWNEPDASEHEFGPYAAETGKRLSLLNRRLKRGCAKLKDTLVIITADHGLVPIEQTILINDCGQMADCLAHPLSMDGRCCSIFLKPGKEEVFKSEFAKYLSADFLLVAREDVLAANLFGVGEMHPEIQNALGDYLIIGITNKSLEQYLILDGQKTAVPFLKGAHAGLTQDEMSVPLILVPCEGKKKISE